MQIRSPPPLPISFISLRLFLDLTPIRRLTPIGLIHRVLFNPGRTVFNCTALLVTYHVRIDSQRYPWITVPQLLLHDSRGRTVCEQRTSGGGRHTDDCRASHACELTLGGEVKSVHLPRRR
jgi:hypothetical protein